MASNCSCGADHEEIRRTCRSSLYATGRILCGYRKGSGLGSEPSLEFHGRVCKWYEEQLAVGSRRVLIMLPRGHLKSSYFTIANVIYKLINDPNSRILIVHAASDKASEWVRTLEDIFTMGDEYHPLSHFFPELLPSEKDRKNWNQKEFTIRRTGLFVEASCKALGLKSTVTGGKYTDIILDDLVDENVASSADTIGKAVDYIKRSRFLLANQRKGRILIVGTFWPGGFYERVIESPVYKKLIVGCYHDERSKGLWPESVAGEPVWPEEFTKRSLQEALYESDQYTFSHQMLNIPVESGMQRFEESDMRYYMSDADAERITYRDDMEQMQAVDRAKLRVYMTVDPSTGLGADESAIVVAAWYPDKALAFVLDIWSGRVLLDGLVHRIIQMWERWKPISVDMESYATQAAYRFAVQNEAIRRGLAIPLRGVTGKSASKDARIMDRDGLLPFFKRNQVYLGRDHRRLVRQLIDYTPGKFDQKDDLIDALCYQKDYWRFRSRPDVSESADYIPFAKSEEQTDGERWYGLECA